MITGSHPSEIRPGSQIGELPLFDFDPNHALRSSLAISFGRLCSILADGRWHTAKELKVHGFSDRELRELVENSDGEIFSFPGSPGYKLFAFVTEEEFQQCASLKHQAERMLSRYSRYQCRHHRHE